jgi:NDP-sugar pyrophosphorylase family protein
MLLPPSWDAGDLAITREYLCEPGRLEAIPSSVSDFGHDAIPALLAADAPVWAPRRRQPCDISTPESYAQAQYDWER